MRLVLAIFASIVPITGAQARELTAEEKSVIGSALAKDFRDPSSAKFQWTPWQDLASGDGTVMYCGEVNAKGASGNCEGYIPYLAAVLVKSGKIADAILIGTHSRARLGTAPRCASASARSTARRAE